MGRASTLPKRLQPMLATLTDGLFDDPGWIFEDKYDGFRSTSWATGWAASCSASSELPVHPRAAGRHCQPARPGAAQRRGIQARELVE